MLRADGLQLVQATGSTGKVNGLACQGVCQRLLADQGQAFVLI
ncbi:hypothetical protein [Pseudomonas sp. 1152_12]